MPRRPDRISVHTKNGQFDRFSSLSITNDITSPTEATFEIGDDDAYNELRNIVAPGEEFTVRLNGRPRLKGRAEVNVVPASPQNGIVIQLTVRTKLSDARYASADPSIKVENVSIRDFILRLYAPLGFTADDFNFAPFSARNLITGKAAGASPPDDFEAIKVAQAKVNPPETIHNAAERHLKRYGATQWHGPDGRIIIGRPDDSQAPTFCLLSKRGPASRGNNVISYRKIVDFSEVPSLITVYGQTAGKDITKARIKAEIADADATRIAGQVGGHFNRRVIMSSQQAKTQAQADRIALRELSARIRKKDALEVTVDGWTYWNGSEQIPWANNTTASVDFDGIGGAQGRYLIVRTDLSLNAMGSATTRLSLVAPGIWVI